MWMAPDAHQDSLLENLVLFRSCNGMDQAVDQVVDQIGIGLNGQINGAQSKRDQWPVCDYSNHPGSSILSDRYHDRCHDHDDDDHRGRFSANGPNCEPANAAADCAASVANEPASVAISVACATRCGHHDCVIWISRSDASAADSWKKGREKGGRLVL